MAGVINAAGSNSGLLGLVGFLSLFWAGSNLFTAIERSFARIFDAPPRGIVEERLIAFFMILVYSALLILSIAAANLALLLGWHRGSAPAPGHGEWNLGQVLGLLGGWGVAVVLHLVLYLVVPNVRLPFRALWPGAVFAGTALQLVTLVFPLYIRYFAGVNRFGDAFSLTFLLMTWSYLVAFIMLAGAEIDALRGAAQSPGRTPAAQRRADS